MTKEQAYKMLQQILANINTTAAQHQQMQQALNVLMQSEVKSEG